MNRINKKSLVWLIIGAIISFFLIALLDVKDRTFLNVLNILGITSSVTGLIIAYITIKNVDDTSRVVKTKIEDTLKSLRRSNTLSGISKSIVLLDEVETYLKDDNIQFAIIRIKDVLKLISNLPIDQDSGKIKNYQDLLIVLKINLRNLQRKFFGNSKKINKLEVVNNLNKLSEFLVNLENEIKYHG
jgi:hypothetical protein